MHALGQKQKTYIWNFPNVWNFREQTTKSETLMPHNLTPLFWEEDFFTSADITLVLVTKDC